MPDLAVTTVANDELPIVWPLVRSAGYAHGLTDWLREGRALMARGGRILAVRSEHDTFYGVATCEAVHRRERSFLNVDRFVAFEVSRNAPVRRALAAAVVELSRELGCGAIAAAGPDNPLLGSSP